MALNPYDPNVIRPGDTVLTEGGLTLVQSARSLGKTVSVHQRVLAAIRNTQRAIHRRRALLTTARHQRRNAARRHR